MKIKMYQSGGIYYTPIFRESLDEKRAKAVDTVKSNSGDKEGNFITKAIIETLKENGLPNDVDKFLVAANTFLGEVSFWSTGTEKQFNMADLIKIKSLANRVKTSRALFDKSMAQVTTEGSGSEAAISSDGKVYVFDGEKIDTVTLNDYYENRDNLNILTNTELLHLREEQPELAYRDDILVDLSNSVGIKNIVGYVKGIVNDLGKQIQKSGSESFIAKNKGKLADGIKQLLGGNTPEGIYKLSHKGSKSEQGYDQNDKESLKFALNYLYNALPPNMRNVLQAQSVAEGFSPKENGAQKFLYQAILEHTDHEYTVENGISYQAEMSRASGVGGDKSSEKDTKLTRSEMIARIAPDQMLPIQGSADTAALLVPARNVAKPEDKNGKKLGVSTIYDVFKEDPIGHYLAMESVSFGGQLISEQDTRRLMYDGASDLHKVYLPIRTDIYSSTGEVVPDFDAASRFEQFKKWLDAGYGVMPNSIIMKMQELNLDIEQDANGNWYFRNDIVKPFITLNGYASSTAVDFDKKSK